MVTDMVGSTALKTTLGDEGAQERIRAQAHIVRSCVTEHGGHEVDNPGDGFLVVFDGALPAVECAAEVQRHLARWNFLHPVDPVVVRIGLSSGEVIRKGAEYYGAVINAASRICRIASGGEVLVSRVVRDLVGSASGSGFSERGCHTLKGFSEAWPLYAVSWRDDSPPATRLTRHLQTQTPFIGRDAETRQVVCHLEESERGIGGILLLSGEAGIGKSRLVGEVKAAARSRRFSVFEGHCSELGDAVPYGAFTEAMRPLAQRMSRTRAIRRLGEGAWWVAKIFPEVAHGLDPRAVGPDLPAEQQRQILLRALMHFAFEGARRAPMLLVLEDIHWADESTILLLRYLAHEVSTARVVVLGTYRDADVEPTHPLAGLIGELHRHNHCRQLALKGLSLEEMRRMLHVLAECEPPEELVDAVYRETEGVPFFVEQVVKLLVDENRLFDANGGWRSSFPVRPNDLPREVGLLIGRRATRLSPRTHRTLQAAAIIGRRFSQRLLGSIADLSAADLLAALDEATRARLIESADGEHAGECAFTHELVRQTLYTELTSPLREALHLRVAEALEAADPGMAGPLVQSLAFHYEQAGGLADPDKAHRYLRRAGDFAMQSNAYAEAARHYKSALERLPAESVEWPVLSYCTGRAECDANRWEDAERSWNRAAAAWERRGDSEGVARACHALALLHTWRGEHRQRADAVRRGLLASVGSKSRDRGRLLAMASGMLSTIGQWDEAEKLHREALAIAHERNDTRLLGATLTMQGLHNWLRARFLEGSELFTQAEDLLRSIGDLSGLTRSYALHLIPLGYLGRLDQIEARLDELESLARRVADSNALTIHAVFRGIVALCRGQLEEAGRWTGEAVARAEQAGREMLGAAIHNLAEIDFHRGRWEEVEERFEEAARLHRELGSFSTKYEGPLSRLFVRAYRGDRAGAEELLPEVAAFEKTFSPSTAAGFDAAVTSALALVLLGRGREASRFYEPIREIADRSVVFASGSFPLVSRVLGMIASANGCWEPASAHFTDAIEQAKKLGARKELIEVNYWFGCMLIDQGGEERRAQAYEHLDQAREGYRSMGMPRHLEMVESLRAGARGD
jgi:class 3 adenylate cyclase/tetratricopeptide (TPR) repeat protein